MAGVARWAIHFTCYGDLVVEGVLLIAGVNNPQVLKTQVSNGSVHGAASARCMRVSEILPRCLEFRMGLEVSHGAQLKQRVQNPAVANEDLGSLNLPLTDVLGPGKTPSG